MNKEEILEKIAIAIRTLLSDDKDLFKNSVNERSITHKLATYLQPLFLDYNVDCEYNRNISITKKLYLDPKAIEAIERKINSSNTYSIYPDIIIHKRGDHNGNLVIIEVKKDDSDEEFKTFDILKLKALTKEGTNSNNPYNYTLGIALVFKTKSSIGIAEEQYFENGKKISPSISIENLLTRSNK